MEEFKIRTFGRVKGRKLSQSQNNKLENLLPQFEIKVENDKILNFPTDNKKLIFEIGFGYGEQIANQAILHKDCNLIGCETYVNGVLSLLTKIEENKIENIKIFNNDARLLLEKMPDKDVAVLSFYSAIASASDNIEINCDHTVRSLKELGFKWPKIKLGYLKYLLKIN